MSEIYVPMDRFHDLFLKFKDVAWEANEELSFSTGSPGINENYKRKLHAEANERLNFKQWNENDIGSGKIVQNVINSIEMNDNNLFRWQSQWGD